MVACCMRPVHTQAPSWWAPALTPDARAAGDFPYFAPASTLTIVEFILFAWVEVRRYQDMVKPGSTNQDPIFSQYSLPSGNEPGYPGGIFNPLGFGKSNMEARLQSPLAHTPLACFVPLLASSRAGFPHGGVRLHAPASKRSQICCYK